MTILEAKKIRDNYYDMTNPSDEDKFLYSEALDYLISETKDSDYMNELGAMYRLSCAGDFKIRGKDCYPYSYSSECGSSYL